ncbi:MAG: hypothetical protein R3360_04185, partial [Alphaproteobacteria bacterium]|nr:hypothetical protein [Alphaproteobacteria bacterium]
MVELPPIETITPEDREAMAEAAVRVVEIAQGLAEKGENVVSLVTHETDTFEEWRHYPKGDIFNTATASQFYYHSHNGAADEHGHFHTFIRSKGLPEDLEPVPHEGE